MATGPNPTITTVNILSSTSKGTFASLATFCASSGKTALMDASGKGSPVRMGRILGCWIICSAAKQPVGRMSARRRSEGVDEGGQRVSAGAWDDEECSACVRHAYVRVCAPGTASLPERRWCTQHEVQCNDDQQPYQDIDVDGLTGILQKSQGTGRRPCRQL